MSLARRILNPCLRLFEKRHLARVEDPGALQRSFEVKARLFFRPPRGSRFRDSELGGVPVHWALARDIEESRAPLILYFHGGGYVFGSPRTHRAMLARLSALTGLPSCLPAYRKAPEHAFPAAVEDALAVYRHVADRPGGVLLGGDSAGGGLALALLGEILRLNLSVPLGVFAFSPLADLTFSGASIAANAASDVILPAERAQEIADMYLQGTDARDPRASPLYASFEGAPPVWLTVGDTEILLDDTRRMARKLEAQGAAVTEIVEHDLPHVWPIFQGILPEASETLKTLGDWISSLPARPDEN